MPSLEKAAALFKIMKFLGEGALGQVYLAQENGREIALKFLNPEIRGPYLDFFREEVKLLSHLSHPNLVKIYDFFPEGLTDFETEKGLDLPSKLRGTPLFSMEYLDGPSLEKIPHPLDFTRALSLFTQICQGLSYLHSRNVLHRDLKPSNLQLSGASEVKILDFNLSTFQAQDEGPRLAVGTATYMPPEAFEGNFSPASDLFSLGVVFYELLSGKRPYPKPLSDLSRKIETSPALQKLRPDLPDYFSRLIHWLIELSPSRRPSSALSVIRYLNEHLEKPIPLTTVEISDRILQKVPFIGRVEEFQKILKTEAKALERNQTVFLHVTGPMGVGRSRLIEEARWHFLLEGKKVFTVSPANASLWFTQLTESMGQRSASGPETNWLTQARDLLDQNLKTPWVLTFLDLQDWSDKDIETLQISLRLASKKKLPWMILLETRSELLSHPLKEFLKSFEDSFACEKMVLSDLNPAQAKKLLTLATVEVNLNPSQAEALMQESGGRPLFLLEALRLDLEGVSPGEKIRVEGVGTPAEKLKALTQSRIEKVSRKAQALLALVASHFREVEWIEAQALWDPALGSFEEALLELDRRNFLKSRNILTSNLRLEHPSLKKVLQEVLPKDLLEVSHRRWIHLLQNKVAKNSSLSEEVLLLVRHAWALSDMSVLKEWGMKAAEIELSRGELLNALESYQKLLRVADTPQERMLLNAHIAPLYYRLARFDETLLSYDRWIADRVDDESGLQKLKHLYYTGLTLYTAGRLPKASQRLEECLKAGDADQYPSHKPYLSRAFSTLASLHQREGQLERALHYLEKASSLAENNSLLLGEIEQGRGQLEQLRFHYIEALFHFQKSQQFYHEANNPQAEAIAFHSLAMVYRECGDFKEAFKTIEPSLQLSLKAGLVLQWARLRENLGILYLDVGDYRKARQTMEEAEEVLDLLAKPEDRGLIEFHRARLHLSLGNFEKSERILRKAASLKTTNPDSDLKILGLLGTAEWDYASRHYSESLKKFKEALTVGPSLGPSTLQSLFGTCRAQAQLGSLSPSDEVVQKALALSKDLPFPFFQLWRVVLEFLSCPSEEIGPQQVEELLRRLAEFQSPEICADLYQLLMVDLKRRGLPEIAQAFQEARKNELLTLYQNLPEENKMDFEKNHPLDQLKTTFQKALATGSEKGATTSPPPLTPGAPSPTHSTISMISEVRFRQYNQINKQILKKNDLSEIFERVMDAAIELTGAERGFLLLKGTKTKSSPLAGYDVKTARHFQQRSLGQKEFQFSLSAVKKAIEQGSYLLTDNAQADEELKGQKSVVMYQLKSILVVPLEIDDEILGAIYLDHPYRQSCFSEEDVVILSAFASQAALGIQKAQLVGELQKAKDDLLKKVEIQAHEIEVMSDELAQVRSRGQLRYGYEEIIGQSPGMMKLFELMDHVTETPIPVWIMGESGTGKELIARSLHFNSPRKKATFVAENCSAIPETLLESELFGHKKGAFTHADRDRIGLFEQASGGTLFLDEVADMSLPMQAKLLRAIQEGEIRPLGSSKTIKVDVRLVTASNRDLSQMVKEGKFRQDLFFRINGLTLKLPPLRERKEDIPLLVEHFIKKNSQTLKLPPAEVGEEAMKMLIRYPWPGNIRELEGAIRTALLFAKGKTILPEHLQLDSSSLYTAPGASSVSGGRAMKPDEESSERQMIMEALKQCKLDKEAAAKKLGMGLRTLYTRMGFLGIPKKKTLLAQYLSM